MSIAAMMNNTPPYFILTGPPGSGKTTLLESLKGQMSTVDEPARRVLAAQRRIGGTATGDQDPARFVDEMLSLSIEDYDGANGLTLFDRGLPDLLAFSAYYDLNDDPVRAALTTRPYGAYVFFLPSWADIYEQDDERRLDFAGAQAFGSLIKGAYESLGYPLITVPKAPLAERAAFVRKHVIG